MRELSSMVPPEIEFIVPEGMDLQNFLESISHNHKLTKKGVIDYHGTKVPFEKDSDIDQIKRQVEEALKRRLQ